MAPATTYRSIAKSAAPKLSLNASGAQVIDGVIGKNIIDANKNIHFISVIGEWRDVRGLDIAKYMAEASPLRRISKSPDAVPVEFTAWFAERISHIAPAAL